MLLAITLFGGSSYSANDSDIARDQRKGRLLGITGYLTGICVHWIDEMRARFTSFFEFKSVHFYRQKGNSDSFRGGPFWKQWNAVLSLNVQKHKEPRGNVIVLPASLFYYPPGGHNSPNSFAFAGSGYYPPGLGNSPFNTQFDEAKPLDPTLAVASATTNVRYFFWSFFHWLLDSEK